MSRWSIKQMCSIGLVGVFIVGLVHLSLRQWNLTISVATLLSSTRQLMAVANQTHNLPDARKQVALKSTQKPTTAGTKLKVAAPKYLEANVYKWKEEKWQKIPKFCSQDRKFNSAMLRTPVGNIKMYIHDIGKDVHVSGSIKRSGMWEAGNVQVMINKLKADPKMGLLDLGSQLGTFSLVAALAGHQVVAVDPLVENVLRLCRSVQEANLANRITILFTALSDTYRTVTFQRESNNIGGTKIRNAGNVKLKASDNFNPNLISTVRLDDILQFANFSKAFMKIDVESHEFNVLKEGKKLLDTIDVRGILMEWFQLRRTETGRKLKQFLTNRTYHAVNPGRGYGLNPDSHDTWPTDVLWLKP